MRKRRMICTILLASILLVTPAYAEDIVTDNGFIVDSDTGEFIGTVGYNPNEGIMPAKIFGEDDREAIGYKDMIYPYCTAAYLIVKLDLSEKLLARCGIQYNKYVASELEWKECSGVLTGPNKLLTCAHVFETPIYYSSSIINGKKVKTCKLRISSRGDNYKEIAEKLLENNGIYEEEPIYADELTELIEYLTPKENEVPNEYINTDLVNNIHVYFRYDDEYLKTANYIGYIQNNLVDILIPKHIENDMSPGNFYINENYRQIKSLDYLTKPITSKVQDREAEDKIKNTNMINDARFDIACIILDKPMGTDLGWVGINYKSLPGSKEQKSVISLGYPTRNNQNRLLYQIGTASLQSNSASTDSVLKTDSIDTSGGQSGGPLITTDNNGRYIVIGVCSCEAALKNNKGTYDSYNLFSALDLNKFNKLLKLGLIGDPYEE